VAQKLRRERHGEYHDLPNREACFRNVESDARYSAPAANAKSNLLHMEFDRVQMVCRESRAAQSRRSETGTVYQLMFGAGESRVLQSVVGVSGCTTAATRLDRPCPYAPNNGHVRCRLKSAVI